MGTLATTACSSSSRLASPAATIRSASRARASTRPRASSSATGHHHRQSSFCALKSPVSNGGLALRARFPSRRRRRNGGVAVAELPSLIPDNADDALGRFRKVLTPLYLGGGLLHAPDLFGMGPICAATAGPFTAQLFTSTKSLFVG